MAIIRTTGLLAVLLVGLVHLPALAADDKTIIIDEGLAASAEVLPVNTFAPVVSAQGRCRVACIKNICWCLLCSNAGHVLRKKINATAPGSRQNVLPWGTLTAGRATSGRMPNFG